MVVARFFEHTKHLIVKISSQTLGAKRHVASSPHGRPLQPEAVRLTKHGQSAAKLKHPWSHTSLMHASMQAHLVHARAVAKAQRLVHAATQHVHHSTSKASQSPAGPVAGPAPQPAWQPWAGWQARQWAQHTHDLPRLAQAVATEDRWVSFVSFNTDMARQVRRAVVVIAQTRILWHSVGHTWCSSSIYVLKAIGIRSKLAVIAWADQRLGCYKVLSGAHVLALRAGLQ